MLSNKSKQAFVASLIVSRCRCVTYILEYFAISHRKEGVWLSVWANNESIGYALDYQLFVVFHVLSFIGLYGVSVITKRPH